MGQLLRHYQNLVSFVKSTEPAVAHIDETTPRTADHQGPPAGVDVKKMEEVVKHFSRNWRQPMDQIQQHVMASFSNFSNGTEILKLVLRQLLVYYKRLQAVINKSFPHQPPAFANELVSYTTILTEIKQYSRSF